MAKNYFMDKDIQYHFKKTIDWEKLVPLYEDLDEKFTLDKAVKMYSGTLKELGKIASSVIADTARETDEIGAQLENGDVIYTPGIIAGLEALTESDALALNIKKEYEGPGMPGLVHMLNIEMMSKADPAFMTIYGFYSGVGKTLEAFGSEELKKKYIPKLASGEMNGSMSLTEPDAGSDLGKIATTAKDNGDGTWTIDGTKIFITNGNGELSLVLAKSNDDATGTDGISMYLVPRTVNKDGNEEDNFTLSRLEHKLGIKGSPTLELIFKDSEGYLVGNEGEGLKQMFYLMNEARLGVSAQALGIACRAFGEAEEYAKGRKQFDKAIAKHELLADKLLDIETDIKGMRSLIYKAAEYDDIKAGLEDKLKEMAEDDPKRTETEKKIKKYKVMARDLIPLTKYFSSEKAIEITRDCIQIHGGVGYTTEFDAEMHHRNAIITAIYEGTSQIQSLMAMGDTLKHSKATPYLEGIKSMKKHTKFGIDKKVCEAECLLNEAIDHLKRPFAKAAIKKDKQGKKDALSYAMVHAERLTKMKTYKTIIGLLGEEAKADKSRKPLFERFARNYLPDMEKQLKLIKSNDKSTLDYIAKMK